MRKQTVIGTLALGTAVVFGSIAYATHHEPKSPPNTPPVPGAVTNFNAEQTAQIETIIENYLLNHPEILIKVSQKLRYKQAEMMLEQAVTSINNNKAALVNDKAPILGNADGAVSVVEFFDYQCGHCKRVSPVLDELVKNNNDVRLVLKVFPIFGESSMYAAKAAIAAQKQGKFKAMHKALLQSQGRLNKSTILKIAESAGLDATQLQKDMDAPDVAAEIQANTELANKLGLRGTPAFIITTTDVESKTKPGFIPGAPSLAKLESEVNQQLLKPNLPEKAQPAPGKPVITEPVEAEPRPAAEPNQPNEEEQPNPKTQPTPPTAVPPASPAPGQAPL